MIMPWWVRAWQSLTHNSTQSNPPWAGTHIAAAPEARGLTRQDSVSAGHSSAELWLKNCIYIALFLLYRPLRVLYVTCQHSHTLKETASAAVRGSVSCSRTLWHSVEEKEVKLECVCYRCQSISFPSLSHTLKHLPTCGAHTQGCWQLLHHCHDLCWTLFGWQTNIFSCSSTGDGLSAKAGFTHPITADHTCISEHRHLVHLCSCFSIQRCYLQGTLRGGGGREGERCRDGEVRKRW